MSYNGPITAELESHALIVQGYELYVALTYTEWPWGEGLDEILGNPLTLSGWEIRRRLKKWASEKNYDIKIRRATEYHEDLHGSRVYEIWMKRQLKGVE